mmetsp:Transcript_29262/g.47005  ORF Transcript_29262/g.47005 Transcript_29262/m.47005 type:complete len:101 (+) Transcript_29262:139-441(+)
MLQLVVFYWVFWFSYFSKYDAIAKNIRKCTGGGTLNLAKHKLLLTRSRRHSHRLHLAIVISSKLVLALIQEYDDVKAATVALPMNKLFSSERLLCPVPIK